MALAVTLTFWQAMVAAAALAGAEEASVATQSVPRLLPPMTNTAPDTAGEDAEVVNAKVGDPDDVSAVGVTFVKAERDMALLPHVTNG